MKKLFLASVVGDTIDKLIKIFPKPLNQMRIAFIPTAADPYDDKWFLNEDLIKLKEKGFDVKEVDIKNKTRQELLKEFKNIDILFVAGGNTFYLLQKARESSFDKVARELVEKGIIYVGSSAGAILAGPNIESIKPFDDPDKAPGLKSFKGLNLVDFVVLPHFDEKKNKLEYENAVKKYKNLGYEFILLTDKQAIVVNGDNYEIV